MNDIEHRLVRLESQVRRWRLASCIGGVSVIAVLAAGARRQDPAPPEVLRAKELHIVDELGTRLLTAGVDHHGHGVLMVFSKEGRPSVAVATYEDDGGPRGGIVQVKSHQGGDAVTACSDPEGHGVLSTRSLDRSVRAALWASPAVGGFDVSQDGATLVRAGKDSDGRGAVWVSEASGEFLARVGAGANGGSLELRSDQGDLAAALTAAATGAGQLDLLGGGQSRLLSAGADADGNGMIRLGSSDGTVLVTAGAAPLGVGGALWIGSKDGDNTLYAGVDRMGEGQIRISSNVNSAGFHATAGGLVLDSRAGDPTVSLDGRTDEGRLELRSGEGFTRRIDSTPRIREPRIESRIKGKFHGFERDRNYTLVNGQVWQQTSTESVTAELLRPHVSIARGSGRAHTMTVEGSAGSVTVERVERGR